MSRNLRRLIRNMRKKVHEKVTISRTLTSVRDGEEREERQVFRRRDRDKSGE